MQSQYPQTFNPAAILGFSGSHLCVAERSPTYLSAYRRGVRIGKYEGYGVIADTGLHQRLTQLPIFGATGPGKSLSFHSAEFSQVLEIMGLMHAAGHFSDDPLQYQQAAAEAAGGVSPSAQTAYGDFVSTADGFLVGVQALNLAQLVKSKGIRNVVAPCIARALTFGSSGVHVTPDPYDPRYVKVECYSLNRFDALILRDLAFDYFESHGLRVEMRFP